MNYKEHAEIIDKYRSANGIHWKRKYKETVLSQKHLGQPIELVNDYYYFEAIEKITYTITIREIIEILKKTNKKRS